MPAASSALSVSRPGTWARPVSRRLTVRGAPDHSARRVDTGSPAPDSNGVITGTASRAVVVPAARLPVRHLLPWRRALLMGLVVWLVAQVLHAVVAVLSGLHPGGPLPGGSIAHSWYQWDSAWFTRIAAHGYAGSGAAAFFPLFPLLMAGLDPVLPGGVFGAGLVVGNLALLGALVVLHRLVATESDDATADRALWYLVAFPTGFFLAAADNTALFLALTVGT